MQMPQIKRIKAAVIGCGFISKNYLTNIMRNFYVLDMIGCADIDRERAKDRAKEFCIRAMTVEEIMEDPEIRIVLNLTSPASHYSLTHKLLVTGKNVYTEKPLSVTMEEAETLAVLAREKGRLLASAPDTFLGGGWQTARKLVDDGYIGTPLAAYGVCIRSYQLTQEFPQKSFVMDTGGGIPYDMGAYYIYNLIHILGPVRRVCGFMRIREPERVYLNPRCSAYKEPTDVLSPNASVTSLEFYSGVYGSLLFCSESNLFAQPRFQVYGTEGVLILFDPNDFSGPILLRRTRHGTGPMDNVIETEIPFTHGYLGESRGIGAVDLAYALLNGRKPRADASIALHALEVLHGTEQSGETGKTYDLHTSCERPRPLRQGVLDGSAQEHILDD